MSEHPVTPIPCACGAEAAFRDDRTDLHYCHACWLALLVAYG